jgi:hypothetical protein
MAKPSELRRLRAPQRRRPPSAQSIRPLNFQRLQIQTGAMRPLVRGIKMLLLAGLSLPECAPIRGQVGRNTEQMISI